MVTVIAALLLSPYCCHRRWPPSSLFAACVVEGFARRVGSMLQWDLRAVVVALWGFEMGLARRVVKAL